MLGWGWPAEQVVKLCRDQRTALQLGNLSMLRKHRGTPKTTLVGMRGVGRRMPGITRTRDLRGPPVGGQGSGLPDSCALWELKGDRKAGEGRY